MKSILTKITMGLLCASLAIAPATAAIERAPKAKPATEATTTATHAIAAAGTAASWKSGKITRAEKREARKAIMKALRADDSNTVLLVILALFIPPLAVYLHQKAINTKFWISLLLTLLFFLPGVIYAILVITGNA